MGDMNGARFGVGGAKWQVFVNAVMNLWGS
jgi:hypothetical protein